MNLRKNSAVEHMYKEKRGFSTRDNETVQEWILTHPGCESDAVPAERSENPRGATGASAAGAGGVVDSAGGEGRGLAPASTGLATAGGALVP